MKNRFSILIHTFFFCALFATTVFAQSPVPVNFFGNPLQLNPAIMGSNDEVRVIADYQNQWAAVNNSGFTTMSFTGIYPLKVKADIGKLDVGIFASQDKAGAFTTTNFGLALDYNKEIAPNNNLCFALSGGYMQQALSTNGLTFDNQYVLGSYNPGIAAPVINSSKVGLPSFNAGLMWTLNPSHDIHNMDAYIGLSAFNFNTPNESMVGQYNASLPAIYSVQGGMKVFSNAAVAITPNAVVSLQNGNVRSALGGIVAYTFNESTRLLVGTWYGQDDGFSVMVGAFYKGFGLHYTYEMSTSQLSNVVAGLNSNQLTLSYRFKTKDFKPVAVF